VKPKDQEGGAVPSLTTKKDMIYSILERLDKMGKDRPPFWLWFVLLLILLSIIYIC
jgi:hypothetical protein